MQKEYFQAGDRFRTEWLEIFIILIQVVQDVNTAKSQVCIFACTQLQLNDRLDSNNCKMKKSR
jgi:hypothetical protein